MDNISIINIKKGDKKAFEELFNTFYPMLCSFAENYIKDIQIAEDFVQEIFISLWDKIEDFDNLSTVKSFLYTSVKNKCLNHIKHQKVKDKHTEEVVKNLGFVPDIIFDKGGIGKEPMMRLLGKNPKEVVEKALFLMKNRNRV